MKVVVPILGFILSAFICFVVFSLLSNYQISQVGYSPNKSDKLIDIFIIIAPLFAFFGGWLSLWLYKKHLTKSSSGR